MKQVVVLACVVIVGLFAWLFVDRLSADALGMAVGLVFGLLAGIPMALLVLATQRTQPRRDDDDGDYERYQPRQAQPQRRILAERTTVTERLYDQPAAQVRAQRVFRVVGETLEGEDADPIVVHGRREQW